jgi:hypothetical protein
MKLAEAIDLCEELTESPSMSVSKETLLEALRAALDELARLRPSRSAPAASGWRPQDCEHEELPFGTPRDAIVAMIRKREADGWELHPVTEDNNSTRTYIFVRDAKR